MTDAAVSGGEVSDSGSTAAPSPPAFDGGAPESGGDPSDSGSATGPGTAPDAALIACDVTFVVTGAVVDGLTLQGVYIGGDHRAVGNWDPAGSRPLVQISPGVWTAKLVLNDGDLLLFRFLERGPVVTAWEDWGANSNRSLRVQCLATGSDTVSPDAGGSAVVGTEYIGQFNAKPPDAT